VPPLDGTVDGPHPDPIGTDDRPDGEPGDQPGPEPGDQPAEEPDEEPVNWLDRQIDMIIRFVRNEPASIPFGLLCLFTALWVLRFSNLVILRNNRYSSFDFDAGIFDQAGWLAAHGSQFDTVRGLPLFGHHVTFGFYLFAPFYWLGINGQTVLNVAQVFALGAVPLVAYWVARRLDIEPWFAAIAGAVCLLNFSMSWLAWELFHPEVFAIAPLIAAYGFAIRNQRRWYWLLLFFAIIWKEDIALAIAAIGVVLLIQKKDRRLALFTIALGVVWFAIATQVVLPHFSPSGQAFYSEGFYGNLGSSFSDIARTALNHPSRIGQHLSQSHAAGHARDMWSSVGFVNLIAPETLIIALPQWLANYLSVNSFTWDLHYHYVAVPLVATFLGLIIGLSRLRGAWRGFAAGIALVAALATGLVWSVAPYSRDYHSGYWPLSANANQSELDHAVSLVPKNASVSASYHMVPHLAERRLIFSFPNPWKPRNWGIGDRNQRSPNDVDWIVVMKGDLGTDDKAVLDGVLANHDTWETVYDTPTVVVAKRKP
jgi:uncharacterized membrane protein